ncbi:MAG TPA: hypothetical protein PKI03_02410 [Pseudomonadota bacterium]|nr:hypothetical protein [Pseudomonadota bacterium]
MQKTVVNPTLSAICPQDLGVQAGFWSGKAGDKLAFRPIVGWVTVQNYADAMKEPFVAVVLNDQGRPTLLTRDHFSDFVGVFIKGMTPEQAVEQLKCSVTRQPVGPSAPSTSRRDQIQEPSPLE